METFPFQGKLFQFNEKLYMSVKSFHGMKPFHSNSNSNSKPFTLVGNLSIFNILKYNFQFKGNLYILMKSFQLHETVLFNLHFNRNLPTLC